MSDVLDVGPTGGRRRPPSWLRRVAALLAVAVVVALAVHALGDRPSATPHPAAQREDVPPSPQSSQFTQPTQPTQPTRSSTLCADLPVASPPLASQSGVVALALAGSAGSPGSAGSAGSALERRDRTATSGSWTVVVHRSDGSLGRHGAVVTFPVHETGQGLAVSVEGRPGQATQDAVVWSIGGARARVRGDVGRSALLAVAAGTRVAGGRPVVRAPAGYHVVAEGPLRPQRLRELRYDGSDLAPALGGLVYTGTVGIGAFEDQLYASNATPCGTVRGRPAVVSGVLGGNGTLAWQLSPALVGYLGYSGQALEGATLEALRQLAEGARGLDPAQWSALHPDVVDQSNDLG